MGMSGLLGVRSQRHSANLWYSFRDRSSDETLIAN